MIKKCRINVDSVFKSELSKLSNVNANNYGVRQKPSNFRKNLEEFLENSNVNLLADSITLRDKDIRNYFFKGDDDFKVFLSHFNQDKEIVYKFVSYLNSEGISTFVDSMVWDNYRDLLDRLGANLNERERLNLVAHLHIILASSLTYMIDKCKCFIFLASENSISNGIYTFSPWIYHELLTASIIQTKDTTLKESVAHESLKVQYGLPFIDRFALIKFSDIVRWIG